jgi:methylmalonyl-CoA/ethylmalonyl-CoA epimerase
MIRKIEHIGIAVKDLEQAEKLFEKLLGVKPYKREEVKSEKVLTSFFRIGDIKIELLAPTSDDSVIKKFTDKHGEGFHHIAYATDDIYSEMQRLRKEGFELLAGHPKEGADNKRVVFLHPKSAGGILTELCQDKNAGE